jgi:hypothetical protein
MVDEVKLTEKKKTAIRLIKVLIEELNGIFNSLNEPDDIGPGLEALQYWLHNAVDCISKKVHPDEVKNLRDAPSELGPELNSLKRVTFEYTEFLNKLIKKIEDRSDDFLIDLKTENEYAGKEKVIQLLKELLSKLHNVKSRYMIFKDSNLGNEELGRWKKRAVDKISESISSDEGKNLEKIMLTPKFESLSDLENEISIYAGFLKALEEEISLHNYDFQKDSEEKIQKSKYKKHVFISHSNEDIEFVNNLKHELNKAGFEVWMAVDELKPLDVWREEIDIAIKDSSALIVVMSPHAKGSEYVTYEWAFAFGAEVRVFTIMLKLVELHPRLDIFHYLDFTNLKNRPWEELIDALKSNKNQT